MIDPGMTSPRPPGPPTTRPAISSARPGPTIQIGQASTPSSIRNTRATRNASPRTTRMIPPARLPRRGPVSSRWLPGWVGGSSMAELYAPSAAADTGRPARRITNARPKRAGRSRVIVSSGGRGAEGNGPVAVDRAPRLVATDRDRELALLGAETFLAGQGDLQLDGLEHLLCPPFPRSRGRVRARTR